MMSWNGVRLGGMRALTIQRHSSNYLLATILAAYRDFEDRMELIGDKRPALEIVRRSAA